MSSAPPRSPWQALQPTYTVLLATGLLLPVVGAIERFVYFLPESLGVRPLALATAASVPDLALTGLFPVLVTALGVAYATLWSRSFRVRRRGLATVVSVVAVLPIFLLYGPVVGGTLWLTGFVTMHLAIRSQPGMALAPRLVTMGALFLVSGAIVGILRSPIEPGLYHFADSSGIATGWYLPMGTTDGFLYLAPCASRGDVILVSAGAVLYSDLPDKARPIGDPRIFTAGMYGDCP